jgi:DNA-binding MarR family transcriptional regulator
MQQKPEFQIDLAVRETWHKLARLYNQRAGAFGTSMSIGYILLHIDKHGTPSTQLGPRMGMESTSLSRTIKTMLDKGLIRKEEDKSDKRIVRIFLTESGLEARYIARDVVFEFNNRIAEKIPHEKLEVFQEVMTQIQELIEDI